MTYTVEPLPDSLVLSHLDRVLDNRVLPSPYYLNWHEVNRSEVQEKELNDITKDDMELESTKRKRKRKMNKHKHRKNLKKMKFTLRKQGRK